MCARVFATGVFCRRRDKVDRLQALQSRFGHTLKDLRTAQQSCNLQPWNLQEP